MILLMICSTHIKSQKWEKLKGPLTVDQKAILITQNGDIYVSLATGSIYKSKDNGLNWVELNKGIITSYLSGISLLKEAITGEIFYKFNNILYVLEIENDIWQVVNQDANYYDIVPKTKDSLYAVDKNNLFLSVNGGRSFNKKASLDCSEARIYLYSDNNNFIITRGRNFSTSYALYSFNPDGNSMKYIRAVPNYAFHYSVINRNIYIPHNKGLGNSIDSGKNVTLISNEKLMNIDVLAIHPHSHKEIIILSSNGIFLSQDSLKNWIKLNNTQLLEQIELISRFYYSDLINSFYYIYRNTSILIDQFGNKEDINLGINSGNFYFLKLTRLNNLLVRTEYDWYLSRDKGNSWIKPTESITEFLSNKYYEVEELENNYLLLYTTDTIMFSPNEGGIWIGISKPRGINRIGKFFALSSGSWLVSDFIGPFFISQDKGKSWSRIEIDLNRLTPIANELNLSSTDILYFIQKDSLFYTTDECRTWRSIFISSNFVDMAFISESNTIYWRTYNSSKDIFELNYTLDFGNKKSNFPLIKYDFKYTNYDEIVYINNSQDTLSIYNISSKITKHVPIELERKDSFLKINTHLKLNYEDLYLCSQHDGIYHFNLMSNVNDHSNHSRKELILYPNPAQEFINLNLPDESKHIIKSIRILDLHNKLILEYLQYKETISVECINPGVYLLTAEDKRGRFYTNKLFIIR